MKQTEDKIKIFLEAIPWLKEFKGKIFVLKYGGELLQDKESLELIAEDIDLLCTLGIHSVVVHGGGPQLDAELAKKGIQFEKKEGMRVSSGEIIREAQRVFKGIAQEIQKNIRIHHIKTKLIPNDYIRVKRAEDLGFVGKVTSIDPLFAKMIVGCTVPIMPLLGFDEEGHLCNINADDMAVSVAEMLGAEKLIIHTSVDGVLDDKGKRITHLDLSIAEEMIRDGHIKGGMIPKVIHALESEKVGKIHIINGQIPHALLYEVFTSGGIGTEIVR
ncbi:acetylglutamate kinase [candidate division WS5 bacterium]|uniref:acetylglutamate kinase n=1 Tax=candidate division WS5 bacterium TaxID=2093353 RepID=A0A419DE64_9BACT|nr:MAG: acetylglutamate kinase [candidate division WS5 bacterium]